MSLFARILVELVERGHVDEQLVAAGEDQPHRLLPLLADGDRLHPRELADPIIHVNDEVAGTERLDLAERKAAARLFPLPRRRPVVAVEELVVGVDRQPGGGDLEPLVQRLDL